MMGAGLDVVPVGSQFGPYRIVAALGAGAMGEVYRAHDSRLGRDVAIKVLAPAQDADPQASARMVREARVVAALSHPSILAVYDVGEQDGRFFLVTELLEGHTLRRRIAEGALPWRRAFEIARAVARGLAVAHASGVVHRDLKPENVFETTSGAIKILDFGVAKTMSPDGGTNATTLAGLTAPGVAVGTINYMAPEQLGGRDVDHRADQFAFGILVHELVAGRHPFPGETAHQVAASILRDTPQTLSGVQPDLPPALARVVSRCLSRDATQRYASTEDLVVALDDVKADTDATSVPVRDGRHWSTRVRYLTGGLTAAALIAVAAFSASKLASPDAAPPVALLSGEQVVAVLPFSVIGDGEGYLADGITEAVTRELGMVKSVRVIASNSAFALRDRPDVFDAVRQELGAGLAMRGSVQPSGGRVRINVALVDTRTGSTLWSERYDREASNVFAAQDDIAWQIASRLAASVGSAPPARPSAAQQTTADAYDAYLRGLSHVSGRAGVTETGKRLTAAIAEFERAVSIDPNFALGHATLASAYTQRFYYNATEPVFEQKAFLEIEKALALNPDQAEAYLARAQIVWNLRNGFQHEQSIRDLKRALANNPSLADAHVELGKVFYHIGLLDKAVAANDEAIRLDPLATVAARRRLGALFDARRFDDVREVMSRNPRWLAPWLRAEALLAMGEAAAALDTLRTPAAAGQRDTGFRAMEPNHAAGLAHAYAKLGRRAEAERAIVAAIPLVDNPTGLSDLHHAQFAIGCAYALLGRDDEAVRWLTKAADEGLPSYPKFSGYVDVARLKSHPGFIALLERLRRDWERWNATL